MNPHMKYCTYMPALVKALEMIEGEVLELGAGINSTFFLHWMCEYQGRELTTYENNRQFYKMFAHCQSDFHEVVFVEDWDEIYINKPWGIVLVDHAPAARRIEEIKILSAYSQCIIIHDSQGRSNKHYRYDKIYPLFKYNRRYGTTLPQTNILSNFEDVSKWT